MNRSFFTILFFVFIYSISVQAQPVFSEDFSDGMPASFVLVDGDGNTPAGNVSFVDAAWVVTEQGRAVSTSWYSPAGTSDDWMITPTIEIPTVANDVILNFSWDEITPDVNYPDGFLLKISVSGSPVVDSFVTIMTVAEASTTWATKTIDMKPYMGKTVRLAFVNNSVDKYLLFVDNLELIGLSNEFLDLSIVENQTPTFSAGNSLTLGLYSEGNTTKNYNVTYTVDGGTPVTKEILSAFYKEGSTEISVSPKMTPGVRHIKAWVSNMNGLTSDVNSSNDTLEFDQVVYDEEQAVQRKTILEVFTSSTCGPCKPGNEQIKTVVAGMSEEDKPVLLKYQEDFPGSGDPYATAETIGRRNFYSINSIPTTQIDGIYQALNPSSLLVSDITTAQAVPAMINVEASYQIDVENQSIRIFGSYTPIVDLVGVKMMIGIKELTTTKNKKSNEETEFDNVVKKLWNGNTGVDVGDGIAGTTYNFDYSYEFKGDYRLPSNAGDPIVHATEHSVENFENLMASVFFELPEEQYILQAVEAEDEGTYVGLEKITALGSVRTYPNPSTDFLTVDFATSKTLPISIQVIDMSGKLVLSNNLGELASGAHTHTIDLASLVNGTYDVTILSNGNGYSTTFVVAK